MSATKELSVSERVCAAKAEIAAIPKNGKYTIGNRDIETANIDDVYHAMRPVLAKHGLDLKLHIDDVELKQGSGNSPWGLFKARIGFEGEELQSRRLYVAITGPQVFEAVNSYIQKQYLRARFQIETGEFDEEDFSQENPPANPPAKPPVSANITVEQQADLEAVIQETGIDKQEFCAWLGVSSLSDIRVADHKRALEGIEIKRRKIAAEQDRQKAA